MPISISKAVEILDDMSKSTNVSSLEDCIEALKLGYAALRCIERLRSESGFLSPRPLPGETED